MVPGRGFEPRLRDSESLVLPLDDPGVLHFLFVQLPRKYINSLHERQWFSKEKTRLRPRWDMAGRRRRRVSENALRAQRSGCLATASRGMHRTLCRNRLVIFLVCARGINLVSDDLKRSHYLLEQAERAASPFIDHDIIGEHLFHLPDGDDVIRDSARDSALALAHLFLCPFLPVPLVESEKKEGEAEETFDTGACHGSSLASLRCVIDPGRNWIIREKNENVNAREWTRIRRLTSFMFPC